MTTYDSLLSVQHTGEFHSAEPIGVNGKMYYLRVSDLLNYAKVIRTYEIIQGTIYPSSPLGWSQAKKYFMRFKARIYGPEYKLLQMSLEFIDKTYSLELVLTSIDFQPADDQTMWVKLRVIDFYIDVLKIATSQISPSQRELPF